MANLNDTLVNGNLKVTDTIYGNATTATKPYATLLTSSDDLNNVKPAYSEIREYYWTSSSQPSHTPFSDATDAILLVYGTSTSPSTYCLQVVFRASKGIYQRKLINNQWSDWEKVLVSSDNAASATTASNCTGNAETATKLLGFTGRSSSTLSNFPWGHIKDYKSSYNALVTDIYYQASGKDSGDIAFGYRQEGTSGSDWRLDCQIDGYWYQNLGNNRCLDTGDDAYRFRGATFVSGNSNYNYNGTYSSATSSGKSDPNSITNNGVFYCGSSSYMPSASLGWHTDNADRDGAVYAQAYSESWIGEIAQDYRTGILCVRGKKNGSWQSWQRVVSSANFLQTYNSSTQSIDFTFV